MQMKEEKMKLTDDFEDYGYENKYGKSNFIYGTGTFKGDSDRLCGCSGKPSENAADGFCRFSKRCADK